MHLRFNKKGKNPVQAVEIWPIRMLALCFQLRIYYLRFNMSITLEIGDDYFRNLSWSKQADDGMHFLESPERVPKRAGVPVWEPRLPIRSGTRSVSDVEAECDGAVAANRTRHRAEVSRIVGATGWFRIGNSLGREAASALTKKE